MQETVMMQIFAYFDSLFYNFKVLPQQVFMMVNKWLEKLEP